MSSLSRRGLLQAGAGALAGVLAACSSDGESAPTTASPPTTPPAGPGSTIPGSTTLAPTTTVPEPPATVAPSAVDELRRQLTGSVVTPLDASYPNVGLPANSRYAAIRPAVIARCRDEADVITCVRWANEQGLTPVPRGGGHSYAGLSTTTGLLIDLGALNAVTVDPATGVAEASAASLNSDLMSKTIHTPWLLPGGTCLGVGVGGLVLGGGIGYNTHHAGLTCDHLTSTRVVLASGEVVEASATSEPDLFWACRGGTGGTFGINTTFTFQLVEAPTTVTYFRYDFRGAEAAGAMLAAIHRVCQDAPAAFNSSSAAQAQPVGAGGPREAISAFTRGQYVGSPDELRDLMAPVVEAAGAPTDQVVEERPFWDVQQQVWASATPPAHPWGDWSRYAAEPLADDVVERVIDLLADCPVRTEDSNGSVWWLGWVGGEVVDRFGRTDTAYVHRGMSMLMRPTPVWLDSDPPSVGDQLLAWTEDVIGVIAPLTPSESYQNFPNRLLPDAVEQYFAENLERLIDVKTRYDPGNVFHHDQSVPVR